MPSLLLAIVAVFDELLPTTIQCSPFQAIPFAVEVPSVLNGSTGMLQIIPSKLLTIAAVPELSARAIQYKPFHAIALPTDPLISRI